MDPHCFRWLPALVFVASFALAEASDPIIGSYSVDMTANLTTVTDGVVTNLVAYTNYPTDCSFDADHRAHWESFSGVLLGKWKRRGAEHSAKFDAAWSDALSLPPTLKLKKLQYRLLHVFHQNLFAAGAIHTLLRYRQGGANIRSEMWGSWQGGEN